MQQNRLYLAASPGSEPLPQAQSPAPFDGPWWEKSSGMGSL
ncbi:MAG TPA: hypothetical protein VJ436_04430 [Anaerolineales bacterium]|nr:hypothetical protein [Anaerolineales bacterium]